MRLQLCYCKAMQLTVCRAAALGVAVLCSCDEFISGSSKVGALNPLRVHKNRESAGPDPIIDSQLADILQYQKQSFSWAIAREEISPNEHEESNQKPREVQQPRQREIQNLTGPAQVLKPFQKRATLIMTNNITMEKYW